MGFISIAIAIYMASVASGYMDMKGNQPSFNRISDEVFFGKAKMLQPKVGGFHDKNDVELSAEAAGNEDWHFSGEGVKRPPSVAKRADPIPSSEENHSRVKRRAKRRKPGKRKSRQKDKEESAHVDSMESVNTTTKSPTSTSTSATQLVPQDLYQGQLRPSVIFRIHMAEAILKMQYRNYAEDKDESVIEADVEYLRLTRKTIVDELSKLEDMLWLFKNYIERKKLEKNHTCSLEFVSVGRPYTNFTHEEEDIKRSCIFDNVYMDYIPYVVGDDRSLMAGVAPPVLHCDAAMCTSVPFVDSLMGSKELPYSDAQSPKECEITCYNRCLNDIDCNKKCQEMCI